MGLDLYTLRKKGVMVLYPEGGRETAYLLQLVVANALSPDVQELVDRAIQSAYREWDRGAQFPQLVVQLGADGVPRPGVPIFRWTGKRVYCFDDDLLKPAGFLGDKELGGFVFRTVDEQGRLADFATARAIDAGRAKVYRDFWGGKTFQSGEEFLAYRRGFAGCRRERRTPVSDGQPAPHPRLAKILDLIRHIEIKGRSASSADVQYLRCLKEKAAQLGCSSCYTG